MQNLVTNTLNRLIFNELENHNPIKIAVSNVMGKIDKALGFDIKIHKIAWYVNQSLIQPTKETNKIAWDVDVWFSGVYNDTIFEYDKKLCYLLDKDD